ncbi:hypothetical protein [Novosphingopyxis sp. YJ-S2-01]|uniref:hypothetical protein n=1 Tax=Novosphingopyxis sp. YJ-S2-01 TaxID=2794021 RepID=UPI0018DDEE9B|nr:hypothetical protein [Novosphingopyxis sp. YJ-S2-01]MBH9537514.1 hypothetical protein [Novosphingopyxis sp. YJ-S2-01]
MTDIQSTELWRLALAGTQTHSPGAKVPSKTALAFAEAVVEAMKPDWESAPSLPDRIQWANRAQWCDTILSEYHSAQEGEG